MNIEEIKAYLEENKDDVEVKAFLAELSPAGELTSEKVGEYLKTEEGRLLVQPLIDATVTKAIKTRDKAHEVTMESEVKKRVAAEIVRLHPEEEPWKRELREMQESLEKEKTERARDNLKRQLVEEAAKRGVDTFWLDDYTPPSFDEGVAFLQKITQYQKDLVMRTNNELMAKSGYKPTAAGPTEPKTDLSKLTQADLIRLEMEGALDAAMVS